MKYKATIFMPYDRPTKEFDTIGEAARWIDSENNNYEFEAIVESFDDRGQKLDSFFYTEKK